MNNNIKENKELKDKLDKKNQENFNLQQEVRQTKESFKFKVNKLERDYADLQCKLVDTEIAHKNKVEWLRSEHEADMVRALAAHVEAAQKQQQVLSNIKTQTPDVLTQTSRVKQQIDRETLQKEIVQQFEAQKLLEIREAVSQKDREICQLKDSFKQITSKYDEEIKTHQVFEEQLQQAMIWFYSEFKKLALLLNEAKEGKLDCYLLNE